MIGLFALRTAALVVSLSAGALGALGCSVPAVRGGSPLVLATAAHQVQGLAVDAANVYWGDVGSGGGMLMKTPLGGGATTALAPATPFSIAVGAGYV